MSITGSWDTRMKTPIGTVAAVFTFTEQEGALSGVASVKGDEVAMRDIVVTKQGETEVVTWSQSVTRPMRLNLDFEVIVVGDAFTGTSRAGRLPASRVEGVRTAASAVQ